MPRSGPVTKDTSTIALGMAQVRIGSAAANISQTDAVLTPSNSVGSLAQTNFMANVDYYTLEGGYPLIEELVLPLRESASMEITFREIQAYNMALARGLDPNADVDAGVSAHVVVSAGSGALAAGAITVNNAGGVVTERWMLDFESATTGKILGESLGYIGDFDISADIAPDNSGNPYFTIESDDFSGTFAADDTIAFQTTEYVAGTAAYGDVDSGEIKLGTLQAPAFIRMEALYTYPTKDRVMHIIFPRAQVTSSMELAFQAEEAAVPPMTISSKVADSETVGGHANWDDSPLGRIYWESV